MKRKLPSTGGYIFESLEAYKLHKKKDLNFVDPFWENILINKKWWEFWT